MDQYTYRITWSPEDQRHAGTCVEFPSLSWLAETPEAALEGIRRLVAECVEDMTVSGEPPPSPMPHSRSTDRMTVSVTPETHKRLSLLAAEQGATLDDVVSAKLLD
jgi:predicted RNase H-like HicB family nuclease